MLDFMQDRRDKWYDLLDVKSCQNMLAIVDYQPADQPARPMPNWDAIAQRIDWAVDQFFRQMDRAQWLNDDFVPCVLPYTGTEIFAEAFGSPVRYALDNMPFALPTIHTAKDVAKLRLPKVHESSLSGLFDIAEAIRNRTDKRAPVQLPDIQSPMDVASLVWAKEEFLLALIEEPEAAMDLIAMAETLLCEFIDEWFRVFGTESAAHFPLYPIRGGFTFSEDEIGEFSSQMFNTFCLPSINRMSERYGGCSMHCCAHAKHQWEGIKRIKGLRLLNLAQPRKTLVDAAEFFGTDVVHYHLIALEGESAEPKLIPDWAERLPKAAHLVIETQAHDKTEALKALEQLREFAASRQI